MRYTEKQHKIKAKKCSKIDSLRTLKNSVQLSSKNELKNSLVLRLKNKEKEVEKCQKTECNM